MGKYVEPSGYFNSAMKKVLEKGKTTKASTTTKASKKPAPKKSK